MNRRIPEASSLREFFAEQWEHIRQLLEARQLERLKQQSETERLRNAVETIVEGTDIRLRAIGNYQKRLRARAHELLDYIESLVAAMPPAVKVSQTAFSKNSLVNAVFRNTETMHQLFSQSLPVRNFFDNVENLGRKEVFALLFLNRTEKKILGAELRGEIVLREVPQTSVSFSGHQLIAPHATEEGARRALKKNLFETVVQQLKVQMTELRYAQSEEEKRAAMQNPQTNINNPEVYIAILVDQLRLPQRLIKLQDDLLRVSKIGIKLPLDSAAPSNKVRLYELAIEGTQSRVVTLVRYPRDEFRMPTSGPYF